MCKFIFWIVNFKIFNFYYFLWIRVFFSKVRLFCFFEKNIIFIYGNLLLVFLFLLRVL